MGVRDDRWHKHELQRPRLLQDWETIECDTGLKDLLIKWHLMGCRIPDVYHYRSPEGWLIGAGRLLKYEVDDDMTGDIMQAVDFEVSEMSIPLQASVNAVAYTLAKQEPLTHPNYSRKELYALWKIAHDRLVEALETRGVL